MKNKTSWVPSDKNKAEHRREKHPEEYQHDQAKRDRMFIRCHTHALEARVTDICTDEIHNAPRSDVPPAFRQ